MYLEYHELLKKYKEASEAFNEALEEGSRLLRTVTPGATQFKEVIVFSGNSAQDAKLVNYVDKKDYIYGLINQTRNTKNILNHELNKLASEMKESNDIKDKIYYYKWIKRISPYKFSKSIGYTTRQIYRYVEEIKKELYKN